MSVRAAALTGGVRPAGERPEGAQRLVLRGPFTPLTGPARERLGAGRWSEFVTGQVVLPEAWARITAPR